MAITTTLALFPTRIVTYSLASILVTRSSCIILQILAIYPVSSTQELLLGPVK
jgi:hypothetical protein